MHWETNDSGFTALSRFARVLLESVSRDELICRLPDAFSQLLPPTCSCRVVIFENGAGPDDTEGADMRACVPIPVASRMAGVLLIGWDDDRIEIEQLQSVLREAADLVGAAIESRDRAAAEKERAREEAAELRFDMIGMLAHEMRTPLASIKGYSSALLLDEIDWDNAVLGEFLQAISEESDRLADMVNHLLDSTVIEAGVLELNREPVLLSAVLRRTVEKLSHRTERHRLVTSISDDFPVVFADEARVQQVLSNLIDNAIKYSPDGGLILVSGEVVGKEVLIRVSDQGVGIAPEHLNKLFERFFRTEQRRIHGVRGTGLGLPIADAIVRAHGGRIWAESTVDEGTTLSFTLPVDTSGVKPGDDD